MWHGGSPILWFVIPILDFHMLFHCSNVQSDRLWLPFWTSTCFSTALTSNLTDCGFLFGLPQAFPPLQRPIWQIETSLLDFLHASRRFNVQSGRLWLPFWTSTCFFTALTSNPTRRLYLLYNLSCLRNGQSGI